MRPIYRELFLEQRQSSAQRDLNLKLYCKMIRLEICFHLNKHWNECCWRIHCNLSINFKSDESNKREVKTVFSHKTIPVILPTFPSSVLYPATPATCAPRLCPIIWTSSRSMDVIRTSWSNKRLRDTPTSHTLSIACKYEFLARGPQSTHIILYSIACEKYAEKIIVIMELHEKSLS